MNPPPHPLSSFFSAFSSNSHSDETVYGWAGESRAHNFISFQFKKFKGTWQSRNIFQDIQLFRHLPYIRSRLNLLISKALQLWKRETRSSESCLPWTNSVNHLAHTSLNTFYSPIFSLLPHLQSFSPNHIERLKADGMFAWLACSQ